MWLLLDTTGRTDAILCCHTNPPTFFLFLFFYIIVFNHTLHQYPESGEGGGGSKQASITQGATGVFL